MKIRIIRVWRLAVCSRWYTYNRPFIIFIMVQTT